MSETPLERTMRARRSVRRFRADPVPRALVLRLIEAAVTAPSASNKQPWKFLLVENRPLIAELASLVRGAIDDIRAHLPEENHDAFVAYGDYFTRFESAPLVMAPIYKPLRILSHLVNEELDRERKQAILQMEEGSGLAGAAMALQNLLLVAHEIGLGASGMTGPLIAKVEIKARLDIPSGWDLLALVPIGYPAEEPHSPGRKPLNHVVRWIP